MCQQEILKTYCLDATCRSLYRYRGESLQTQCVLNFAAPPTVTLSIFFYILSQLSTALNHKTLQARHSIRSNFANWDINDGLLPSKFYLNSLCFTYSGHRILQEQWWWAALLGVSSRWLIRSHQRWLSSHHKRHTYCPSAQGGHAGGNKLRTETHRNSPFMQVWPFTRQ